MTIDNEENSYSIIDHPRHYCEGRNFEPKHVMNRLGMNCQIGQAFKYISRAGRKGDLKEDLLKARFWINEEINNPIRTVHQSYLSRFIRWVERSTDAEYIDDVCIDWARTCQSIQILLCRYLMKYASEKRVDWLNYAICYIDEWLKLI